MDLVDLLIDKNNLVLDQNGLPQLIGGHQVIAQDLSHRIQDTGLVFSLLGERNKNAISQVKNRIKLACENDRRVIAGSVVVSFEFVGLSVTELYVQAQTNWGDLKLAVPVSVDEPDDGGEGEPNKDVKIIYATHYQYINDTINSVAWVPNSRFIYGKHFYPNRPYSMAKFPLSFNLEYVGTGFVDEQSQGVSFTILGSVKNSGVSFYEFYNNFPIVSANDMHKFISVGYQSFFITHAFVERESNGNSIVVVGPIVETGVGFNEFYNNFPIVKANNTHKNTHVTYKPALASTAFIESESNGRQFTFFG
ncbi:DUF2590 family protein [Pseudomonas sp. HK3]